MTSEAGLSVHGLRWFAVIAALGAVALLLVLPMYEGVVSTSVTGGGSVTHRQSGTLLEANGAAVLIVLAIPVVTAINAILPWPPRFRRAADVAGAIVCTGFTLLGAMTVGMYFIPTAMALLVTAAWPRPVPSNS